MAMAPQPAAGEGGSQAQERQGPLFPRRRQVQHRRHPAGTGVLRVHRRLPLYLAATHARHRRILPLRRLCGTLPAYGDPERRAGGTFLLLYPGEGHARGAAGARCPGPGLLRDGQAGFSAATPMRVVHAVVVTYNRRTLLETCLKSLFAQSEPPSRIVLIDNASNDGTKEWLEASGLSRDPRIAYTRL